MTRAEAVKAWHAKYDAEEIGRTSDEALDAMWEINTLYPVTDTTIPCEGHCEH